jgi:hypothetical protein
MGILSLHIQIDILQHVGRDYASSHQIGIRHGYYKHCLECCCWIQEREWLLFIQYKMGQSIVPGCVVAIRGSVVTAHGSVVAVVAGTEIIGRVVCVPVHIYLIRINS